MTPLRLIALEPEDLTVISAAMQDAIIRVGAIEWQRGQGTFLLSGNRFAWEADDGPASAGGGERRYAALKFARVEGVSLQGISRDDPEMMLSLLSIQFTPGDAPSGRIVLTFAGDGGIALDVECVEVELADVGPAWDTPRTPSHSIVGDDDQSPDTEGDVTGEDARFSDGD
ncbi:MAG: DUF2948 family protein [Pseudomonadota bacterium]